MKRNTKNMIIFENCAVCCTGVIASNFQKSGQRVSYLCFTDEKTGKHFLGTCPKSIRHSERQHQSSGEEPLTPQPLLSLTGCTLAIG